ncbi:MAG: outer membrane beta-barrel protein [Hyphomonadaceae bacterium]
MKKLEVSLAVLAATFGLVAPAVAQDGDNFNRDRNVSVRDRPKPEYDAAGIRMGGFRLYPELLVAGEYNDNIFATDGANVEEDFIWHITPSARLASQWSTHELNFSLAVPALIYSDFSDNNTTDVSVGVDGRLDVYRDFYFHGGASYSDRTEPLSSSPTSLPLAEPIEYTEAAANVGFVKAFNRLRISGEARMATADFEDGVFFNLTPAEQDDRDRTVVNYGLRADYAVSPLTAFFVAVGANTRDYDLDPPVTIVNRDSEGYEALVGANFDLTRLIRGEIGVGYLSQTYDDPTVDETSGLAVRANVEWFPDELVTVSFGASREVADAGAFGASSYVANNASFAIDYEWRRNVVLGFNVGYSFDEYEGIDREDSRLATEFSADYLVDRGTAIFAQLGHYEQESDGLQFGRDYDINRVVVGIRLRR